LQKFHNWVKSDLIASCNVDASLLDLGCGRGGDLFKWKASRLRHVTGLDVSKDSLSEALRRYSEPSEGKKNGRGSGGGSKGGGSAGGDPAWYWGFQFDTVHFDICDTNKSLDAVIPRRGHFDAVSCQFSLHYCFGSLANAHCFLSNVTRRLKPGGSFMATFADGRAILEYLSSEEKRAAAGAAAVAAASGSKRGAGGGGRRGAAAQGGGLDKPVPEAAAGSDSGGEDPPPIFHCEPINFKASQVLESVKEWTDIATAAAAAGLESVEPSSELFGFKYSFFLTKQ
jgi:SAM-dependent methyltransferase